MTWLLRLFGWGTERREALPAPVAPPPVSPAVPEVGNAPDLLTPRDRGRLLGVHPDLVRVVERARQVEPFFVIEGVRTMARQKELFAKGASRTLQ